jgi:hypothetical protein
MTSVQNCTACPAGCATCSSAAASACTTCLPATSTTNWTLASNGSCYNGTKASSNSNILMPGLALLSLIFFYLF